MERLARELAERRQEGTYRRLNVSSGKADFSSNDYLGLAQSEELRAAVNFRLQQDDVRAGSGASRLITGNYPALEKLEDDIARFHNSESALLFNSGYLANLALLSTLPKRGDLVLYDEAIHASLRDGIRLSHAKSYSFRHNQPADLEKKVRQVRGDVFVVVESLYSMDGDFAPLGEFCELAARNGFKLIVDEAHAAGLYGPGGQGLAGERSEVYARVVTYGKAFGVQGASVLGPKLLRDYLLNFARPFIYSTSISPYLAVLIEQAYVLIGQSDKEREMLFSNISEFAAPGSQPGPIQAIIIPGNDQVRDAAKYLQERGYDVRPILSPTVPAGKERLRVCLHAFNTKPQIVGLNQALSELEGVRYAV